MQNNKPEQLLHVLKVTTVWCDIYAVEVMQTFFFENYLDQKAIMDGFQYTALTIEFFFLNRINCNWRYFPSEWWLLLELQAIY